MIKKTLTLLMLALFISSANSQTSFSSHLKQRAVQGDSKAQYELGRCYEEGDGIDIDEEEAIKWYQKAVNNGNSDAALALAYCYYDGYICEKNCAEALQYLRYAAKCGNKKASEMINDITSGISHFGPDPLFLWPSEYIQLVETQKNSFMQDEQNGNIPASFYLGCYYIEHKNINQAILHLTQAYKNLKTITVGDFHFGDNSKLKNLYRDEDMPREDEYLLPFQVCNYLAWCYEQNGLIEKAIEIYSEGDRYSEQSIPCFYAWEGLFSRASCYLKIGQTEKYISLIEKAATPTNGEGCSTKACLIAGDIYRKGEMTSINYQKAKEYYEKAINNDHTRVDEQLYQITLSPEYAEACYNLSKMYEMGHGCEKNTSLSTSYFKEALKYGSPSAMHDDQIQWINKK